MTTEEITQEQIIQALKRGKDFCVQTDNERRRVLIVAKAREVNIVTRKDPKTEKFNVIFLP